MSQTASPRHTVRIAWFPALLAVPLFTSNIASADVACGDTTCPTGFVCEAYDSADCADVATIEGQTASCNATTTYYQCAPAPCSADADCGVGMVCFSSTREECSGGTTAPACAANALDCTATAPDVTTESCTTTNLQQCIPRYLLPCTTATDCGPGFICEETIEMACAGSGGSTGVAEPTTGASTVDSGAGGAASTTATSVDGNGTSSSSTADTTTTVECTGTLTGQFACKLQLIACTTAAGCPAGFTCLENPSGSCSSSSTGESSCTVADPPMLCMPPYADLVSRGVSESVSKDSMMSTTAGSVLTPKASPNDAVANASPADAATVTGGGCNVTNPANGLGSNLVPILLAAGLALGLRCRRQN